MTEERISATRRSQNINQNINIMPLNYKIYMNKNKKNLKTYNKFYARVIHTSTVDTDEMAAIIERNCSVKKSDVLAVLTEMSEVMNDQLQDSKCVKLNGIGTFKLAISCIGAESIKEFNPTKNIKKVRVSFTPITKVDRATNKRIKNFTAGAKMKEYGQYTKIKDLAPAGGDPNGGVVQP